MKNNNRGFTLIEIVMVLVLLGILAAVAIPKYYDLKESAEKASAQALAAEYQARLNGKFAYELVKNNQKCSEARKAAIGDANLIASENKVFTFTGIATDAKGGNTSLTINTKAGTAVGSYDVGIPVCQDNN